MSQSKRCRNRAKRRAAAPSMPWLEGDGLHALLPGSPPSQEMLDLMSEVYRDKIRRSPLWDQMVREFGVEEAERMLRKFRVKIDGTEAQGSR